MTIDVLTIILFLLNGVFGEILTKSKLVIYVSVEGVKENLQVLFLCHLWCYTIEERKSAEHVNLS